VRCERLLLVLSSNTLSADDEPLVDSEASPDNPPAYRSRSYNSPSLSQSGNTRPRRSASLSDALSAFDRFCVVYVLNMIDAANEDEQHAYAQSQGSNYQSQSRPTTSLGFSTTEAPPTNDGPRRVVGDERDGMAVHKSESCVSYYLRFFAKSCYVEYRREADDAERM
jgi:hypothetical protein